jgi:hypothetical protein
LLNEAKTKLAPLLDFLSSIKCQVHTTQFPSYCPTMSYHNYPFQPWGLPMTQPQRLQPRDLRIQQQLLDWIDDIPDADSDYRLERIKTLRLRPEELDVATDHALRLYTRWLSEDLRKLWPLFEGRSGPQAFEALHEASNALWNLALDRQIPARALVIIPRLCQARWDLRDRTDRLLNQAAAGR